MDTSLIINATQNGKKVTKAITNINPEKDNEVLKTFAQKVNALTTNTYVDATRVDKMSVNEQGGSTQSGGGSNKQEGIILIDGKTNSNTLDGTVTFTYNGDGQIQMIQSNPNADARLKGDSISSGVLNDVVLYAFATDNYTAACARVYFED